MRTQPEFEGAARATAFPLLLLQYQTGAFFAGTSRSMAEVGGRFKIQSALAVGGQVVFERGRSTRRSSFLRAHALDAIDSGASLGPFIEANYRIGPVPVEWLVRVRRHVDDELGTQLDWRGTCGIYAGERVRAGVFSQITWGNQRANQRHFSVSTQQAASGGLPEYHAGSGRRYVAAGSLASVRLAPNWDAVAVLEWRRAAGSASRSPVTQEQSSLSVTLGAIYWF